MGLFDWFRRRPPTTATERAAPPSPEGPTYRFLVLMEQRVFADLINRATPFAADHARTLAEALAALGRTGYDAVLALSPICASGSAARLIAAFRERKPGGLCIYHGWDYRTELSAVPAERCGADFLLVGGVLGEELAAFLPAAVERHRRGLVPRPSWEWYERALREGFPRSPFWGLAEQLRARGMPPSEFE